MKQRAFPKRVVIRTDASLQIGTGHVMRCLTLAEKLAKHGAEVQFMCRTHDGNLIDHIRQSGFEVISLPKAATRLTDEPEDTLDHASWLEADWQTDVNQCRAMITGTTDWIIVDHYALDYRWETAMRDKSCQMMCIDDLADREHDCDLLLDQSLGRSEADYLGLVPEQAVMLLGPKYALLRPEFAQWRAASLARRENPQLRHFLITMGGVDTKNVTGRVLSALQGTDITTLDQITVVLGPHAPWRNHVVAQAKNMSVPTSVMSGVDNIAELMTSCDLAFGACGSTTWERCALGVPTIQVEVAMNQKFISSAVHRAGAAIVVEIDQLEYKLSDLILAAKTSNILKDLSGCAAALTDGSGAKATLEFLKWS